ncbi:MAG: Ycf66 family protein [Leptolyngbya sp. BL-A-14]
MVNASLNWSSLLGVALVVLGLFLMIMRGRQSSQANYSGQDLPLAVIYLIAGFILFFRGWRLDPILQFAQLLLVGSIIYRVINDFSSRT